MKVDHRRFYSLIIRSHMQAVLPEWVACEKKIEGMTEFYQVQLVIDSLEHQTDDIRCYRTC